jgi:rhodanese-related sulfurtransferase
VDDNGCGVPPERIVIIPHGVTRSMRTPSPAEIVDVRTRSEVEADRSPDAIHIQVDELPHRYHELKQTQQLIFVCQAGDRSAAAAEFMTSIGGHDIYTVNGGMSAWSGRRASGPIEPKNRT